jgi:hypothetical protein
MCHSLAHVNVSQLGTYPCVTAWHMPHSSLTPKACLPAAEKRYAFLTTEKIRALFDNIRGEKDRIIDGEVMKKDDDDG